MVEIVAIHRFSETGAASIVSIYCDGKWMLHWLKSIVENIEKPYNEAGSFVQLTVHEKYAPKDVVTVLKQNRGFALKNDQKSKLIRATQ